MPAFFATLRDRSDARKRFISFVPISLSLKQNQSVYTSSVYTSVLFLVLMGISTYE